MSEYPPAPPRSQTFECGVTFSTTPQLLSENIQPACRPIEKYRLPVLW